MSDEMYAGFRSIEERTPDHRFDNLQRITADFTDAEALATANGMRLMKHTNYHYQLRYSIYILNVYPTKRRLQGAYANRGPHLNLPAEWTLLDVVKAAIEAIAKER